MRKYFNWRFILLLFTFEWTYLYQATIFKITQLLMVIFKLYYYADKIEKNGAFIIYHDQWCTFEICSNLLIKPPWFIMPGETTKLEARTAVVLVDGTPLIRVRPQRWYEELGVAEGQPKNLEFFSIPEALTLILMPIFGCLIWTTLSIFE